ncbi:hypothetical protein BsWGS_05210 [Bradybaena similaris]
MGNLMGMSYYDDLMHLLKTNPELRQTAKDHTTVIRLVKWPPAVCSLPWAGKIKQVAWGAGGSIAGAAIGGSIAGAAIGGPVGAVIGGIACSVIGYRMSDDYQSLIDTLQGLSDEDKAEVVRRVQKLVGADSIEALTIFIRGQAQRCVLLDILRSAAAKFAKGC